MLLVARYIPVGRVAVNLTAGSIRFPFRRFLAFDVVAALSWGIYSTAFGVIAGRATDNPLLGVMVGIVLAIVVGLFVQWLFTRRFGKADLEEAHKLAHQPRTKSSQPSVNTQGGADSFDAVPTTEDHSG